MDTCEYVRRHSQEAKATVCKTVIPGSSPGAASTFFARERRRDQGAGMAKLVDAGDLKSPATL